MTTEDARIKAEIAQTRQGIEEATAAIERAKAMLYHDEFKYSGEMARARMRRADLARRLVGLQHRLPAESDARGSRGPGQVFFGSNR